MEKFIVAAGAALRINDTVKGDQTLVLIHGYLETLDVWEPTVKQLSKHFRVITFDLPGHGISQTVGEIHTMEFLADVTADVLRQCGVEKAFVAGHSMGGYVALAFAKKYPQMILGLILVHSTPNPDSEEKKSAREREIELVLAGKKDLIATMFAPKGFAPQNRKRLSNRINEFEELIGINDDQGIAAILRGLMAREDMNQVMRDLKAPELMIFGRLDDYITPDAAQAVIATQPQAQVVWLENSAHNGFIEEHEAFEQAVIEFIESAVKSHQSDRSDQT